MGELIASCIAFIPSSIDFGPPVPPPPILFIISSKSLGLIPAFFNRSDIGLGETLVSDEVPTDAATVFLGFFFFDDVDGTMFRFAPSAIPASDNTVSVVNFLPPYITRPCCLIEIPESEDTFSCNS